MSIIPCIKNEGADAKVAEYAEQLKAKAHTIGDHGLDEEEFNRSGLFRSAIERIRGQYAASTKDKYELVECVLNYIQEGGFIDSWSQAGSENRYDYRVKLNNSKTAIIEVKGCLDGNNTTIFERPADASEFVIWSICTNPGADPRHNVWSGVHTRLCAEVIHRNVVVDGVIVFDMMCGTMLRSCPKIENRRGRLNSIGAYVLPPPCIYVFPGTVPNPRENPHPRAQKIEDVKLLDAFHRSLGGEDEEIHYVDLHVEHRGKETVRTTRVVRGGVVARESRPTPLKRSR